MGNSTVETANLKFQLGKLVEKSINAVVPGEPGIKALVVPCAPKFGDYQCNNAMSLYLKTKDKNTAYRNPRAIAEAIAKNLPPSELIESCCVAGQGFVNMKLSNQWIAKSIQQMLLNVLLKLHGIQSWSPKLPFKRAVVDFSSPNIAKELHVGHLRSTIIGDCLARILEFCNVDVLRRNHVGDWGTQFGKLLAYLFEEYPEWNDKTEVPVSDLQMLYKKAQRKYETDPVFNKEAHKAVFKLQNGEARYCKAWEGICNISRKEYQKIYECLGVEIEEKGESFYHPYIPKVLQELSDQGLVAEKDGALMVNIEGLSNDAVVTKSDGSYNYVSTDLGAIWYRLNFEKAEWIIYVTDHSQEEHFKTLFLVAQQAGWLSDNNDTYPKATHVPFGLVLGSDGKRFRTRSTEVVKLIDLLEEAKTRSKSAIIERVKSRGEEWTEVEVEQTAKAIGYGAIKYADLKNNRLTDYTFNPDQMLDAKGNTAVYLLYAHARICSIIRKSGKYMADLKGMGDIMVLDHADERALGLHLVQFPEMIESACENLLPSVVCEYLYNLADYFAKFYNNCQVVGSVEETSRLLLCEAANVVMRQCFYLLGIQPVEKM